MGDDGCYFTSDKIDYQFISSGCTVLDCVIGGGWPLGRVSNIVGDKSTGKTLLAIEACANFARKYPKGKIFYREAEAAFDRDYAAALGLPVDRVHFLPDVEEDEEFLTVSDFYNDLNKQLDYVDKTGIPGLYIVDSLDALADKAELEEKDFDKGTYGTGKAKGMSKLFRQLTRRIEKSNMHLMIISQVRDNIGVTFGVQYTRSGGRALDFYASQIIYLAYLGAKKKTVNKIDRPVGVEIRAKCTKNKIGLPLRQCDFEIVFGFGVDDLDASYDWLKSVNQSDAVADYKRSDIEKMPDKEYFEKLDEISSIVVAVWKEIETSFLPTRKKY